MHWLRRMVQGEFGPDRLGGGGPDKGFRVPVGRSDVAGDGRFEVDNRVEDAPLQALSGKLGKEAFNGVEPGA